MMMKGNHRRSGYSGAQGAFKKQIYTANKRNRKRRIHAIRWKTRELNRKKREIAGKNETIRQVALRSLGRRKSLEMSALNLHSSTDFLVNNRKRQSLGFTLSL